MRDLSALRLFVLSSLLAVGACADVGGDADPSERPADGGVTPRPGAPYDAGSQSSWRDASAPSSSGGASSGNGSSSGGGNGISFTVNDAAVGLDDLLNAAGSLFGGSATDGGAGGSGSASSAGDAGSAGQCLNAPCNEALDCQRLYPASCGFTTCQASLCR